MKAKILLIGILLSGISMIGFLISERYYAPEEIYRLPGIQETGVETARWIYVENYTRGYCTLGHRAIQLEPGWNTAGYTGEKHRIEKVLQHLSGNITVLRPDGDEWFIYNNHGQEFLNNIFYFEPCRGYMIRVDTAQTLIF